MERTVLLFRILFLTGCAAAGWYISETITIWQTVPLAGCLFGFAAGLLIVLADFLFKGVSLRAFSSATFGLFLGLILSWLLKSSGILRYTDTDVQWVAHLIIYLTFSYLGTMLALRSNRDEFSLIIPYVRFLRQEPNEQINLLDTSSIIDGRLGDLCKSGFLDGILIIPRFVLIELQSLADSSDSSKRARGRYGLDSLNELKNNPSIEVKIHETVDSIEAVDLRLITLARLLNARLITTDYNLGRIATLQKVRVLNIHFLASILKTPLMVGENVRIKLIREGKEPHQAVGFLPDGTMIVVNQSRQLIGQEVEVTVSGIIQTTAGRIIFSDLTRSLSASS